MEYTKENAKNRYCAMLKKSWTYAKLTPEEAAAWNNFINPLDIKGTAKQRYEQIAQLYNAFLLGCGYSGFNWRGPDPENTPF